MRLIDADELTERIKSQYCAPCKEAGEDYRGVRCRVCQIGDMLGEIVDCPTETSGGSEETRHDG